MAQILLGYILTSKLEGLTNKAAQHWAVANLFHACMHDVLLPIVMPGERGVAMMSGDGAWHHYHPILASFISDYPEQALMTCTYSGRCPKCIVTLNELDELQSFLPRLQSSAMDTYLLANEEACVFHAACRNAGLKLIFHPFWESLPHANIFISITPNVLHQLLQGMIKCL
jgi:hypothetical protein